VGIGNHHCQYHQCLLNATGELCNTVVRSLPCVGGSPCWTEDAYLREIVDGETL
jgi:hypothetical protein